MASRKNFIASLTLLLLLIPGFSFGQAQEKSVFIGDSVIIFTGEYRGDIQWQKSYDLAGWIDMEGGNADSLGFSADTSAYYRAVIVEANCNPIFSDTIAISAFEEKTYSFPLSEDMDSVFISDENSPLHNLKIEYADSAFMEGDQIEISLYLDTLKIVDSLFLPLGPIVDINISGSEDTLLKPVTIELPISDWSNEDSGVPVVAYYNENSGSWEIIPTMDILDHSIIFQTKHFSRFGAFLFNVPKLVLSVFKSESEATSVFEPLLQGIEDFQCTLGMAKIDMLESIKNEAEAYMYSLDLDKCDGVCLGLDDFLLNIDQQIAGVFISNIVTSHAFLAYLGVTGGVATAITIVGGAGAILFTPCALCIMYNSTINPLFWTSLARYYMAEWGIKYLENRQDIYCSINIEEGSFTDSRDGNNYKTVQIGDQVWMAENLKYLPEVVPSLSDSGSYWVYGYEGLSVGGAKNTYNYDVYGVLYNLISATDACPSGWHLPSINEWRELAEYVNGFYNYDVLVDQYGTHYRNLTFHLNDPDLWTYDEWFPETTNEFGLSLVPGGLKYIRGELDHLGSMAFYWSSTDYDEIQVHQYTIGQTWVDFAITDNYKANGLSVRCVED